MCLCILRWMQYTYMQAHWHIWTSAIGIQFTDEQTNRGGIKYSRMSWKADVHAWLICPISGNYPKDPSCPKAGMTGVH